MRILVTGADGFIGSHLCDLLQRQGHWVIPYDLKRGLDILDERSLQEAITDCDAVYHFAAMVSVPLCQDRPLESYETNLNGTVAVLNACIREQNRIGRKIRFLFAGSSVIYGNIGQPKSHIHEDCPILPTPLSHYGIQKLLSERLILNFNQTQGLDSVVFRFFNVYGPGQDPKSPYSGVITLLKNAISEKRPFTVFGDGNQTRDFISVHDLVKACASALTMDKKLCDGRAINIGSSTSTNINELIQLFQKVSGTPLEVRYSDPRPGDVMHSLASIERAKSYLGFEPKVTLLSGLAELFKI